MYKEVLRTIVGIEVFPILSLVIFVTIFTVMLIWTMRLDRGRLSRYASLPLDQSDVPADGATDTDAPGGTRL